MKIPFAAARQEIVSRPRRRKDKISAMKTLPAFLPLAGLLLAGCASAGKFPKAPDGPYAADYALLQAETFNVSYRGEVRGLKDRGAEREWRRGAGAVAVDRLR